MAFAILCHSKMLVRLRGEAGQPDFGSGKRMTADDKELSPRKARWVRYRAEASMNIEKAALLLFLECGVDNVTVDDIAAAAGVSRRNFYRYFDSPLDILSASPRRSLTRIANEYRERPTDESVLDAFVATLKSTAASPEEQDLRRIAEGVMRRSPEAWSRAMGRMQADAVEIYREMFAERLLANGRDASFAGILAAAVQAITTQALQEGWPAKRPSDIERVGRALKAFGECVQDMKS